LPGGLFNSCRSLARQTEHASGVVQKDPIMDKVLSLLISLGIVILGAWVVVAIVFKGWSIGWAVLALFALLTGFGSLYEALKVTED